MTWTLVEQSDTDAYYEDDDSLDDMWIPNSLRDQLIRQGYEAGLGFGIKCGIQMENNK